MGTPSFLQETVVAGPPVETQFKVPGDMEYEREPADNAGVPTRCIVNNSETVINAHLLFPHTLLCRVTG